MTRSSSITVASEPVRAAVRHATDLLATNRRDALEGLSDSDALRDEAAFLRRRTLQDLDDVLAQWQRASEARGVVVHRARDASDAVRFIVGILAKSSARLVVKGKSMASEEIHLNDALEAQGLEVVETDLGEFIIQLAHETPSHIIVPAIHRSRFDVAELFSAEAGYPIAPVVEDEAAYARQRLRDAFLAADVGITGVNFAVADTGSICLVENEGNGRMCSSLPRIHIAVMGMERIVRDWDELDVMLSLLARSATGQVLSVYTNIISGPRREGELDGPDELYVVVLDNGRSNLIGTEYEDTLACIRCGACLNVCPVYRHVGGHAYRSVYSGPIGAVLSPLLAPHDETVAELPFASTLCGACTDVCPVRIPLHDLLLRLRQRPRRTTRGFVVWSRVWSSAMGYRVSVRLSRVGLRFARVLPKVGWAKVWTRDRTLPRGGDR
ncbi:MAG TPA: LutB/LldF family L-lactate oxidation iron-sulfur protein [Acidimicrobiales bacterium]|nr:LutB/LldF family L-lactate oxidation iron-sulfur protein [Acidimicrobiales bacterium]